MAKVTKKSKPNLRKRKSYTQSMQQKLRKRAAKRYRVGKKRTKRKKA